MGKPHLEGRPRCGCSPRTLCAQHFDGTPIEECLYHGGPAGVGPLVTYYGGNGAGGDGGDWGGGRVGGHARPCLAKGPGAKGRPAIAHKRQGALLLRQSSGFIKERNPYGTPI